MIRVFLVDDQHIIREGVKTLLEGNKKIKIIGEAGDGESALQKIALLHPDVVLLDINLPDIDGFDVAQKIDQKFSHIRTIILSSNEELSYVKKAVSLGAKGYLSKNVSREELEWTIDLVNRGYSVIKPELSKQDSHKVSYSESASTTVSDRDLKQQAASYIQIDRDLAPKPEPKAIKTHNSDDIESILAKNKLLQRYAKYNRRKIKSRILNNINWRQLKRTVASFEFGLLVLIILFSLSFLTMIALSN